MTDPPRGLRSLRNEGVLEITWADGAAHRLSYFDLRCACPCAVCIDEITGAQLLRRENVSPAVAPADIGLVGNYALRISWTDGHASGLYTWERLRAFGDARSAAAG